MAKQNTTNKKATKPENCGTEHVETKNEGTKSAKASKSTKNCK